MASCIYRGLLSLYLPPHKQPQMNKAMSDKKPTLILFHIRICDVLIGLLTALLIVSCDTHELQAPQEPRSVQRVMEGRDSILQFYIPWEPDTSLGVRYHKLTVKEFGLVNDTDTIIHYNGFPRPTHRWIEDGYPVKYDRDTSYSLLPDSVPASFYFQATFKTYYPYGMD